MPRSARFTHAAVARDAESRISDTRVRCIPAVAKRGLVRSVALVTTERPVHERTPSRAAHTLARRLSMLISLDAGLLGFMTTGDR